MVGTGRTTRLAELFRAIAEKAATVTGRRPPSPVVTVAPPPHATPADFRIFAVDPAPFRAITGWRTRVPLHEGLRRALAVLSGPGIPGPLRH
ncbi:hypothetical protein [Streptomyces sp. 6N223]|uniref:hypothetical protein n=1 Tax=Streptomyces sp. 6N223 TaxID=3457412 RepID=UPI003FD5B34F